MIFSDIEIGSLFCFVDERIEPPVVFRRTSQQGYERRIRGDTPRYIVPLQSLPVFPVKVESVHLIELGMERVGNEA